MAGDEELDKAQQVKTLWNATLDAFEIVDVSPDSGNTDTAMDMRQMFKKAIDTTTGKLRVVFV